MTPAAIQSASAIFDKVNADGKTLDAALEAFIKELDDVAGSMSPTGSAAAPAKK